MLNINIKQNCNFCNYFDKNKFLKDKKSILKLLTKKTFNITSKKLKLY